MIILHDFAEVQLFATFSNYSAPPSKSDIFIALAEQSKELKPGRSFFDRSKMCLSWEIHWWIQNIVTSVEENVLQFTQIPTTKGDNYWQDIAESHIKNIKKEWRFVWNLLHPKGCYMASSTKGNIKLSSLLTQMVQNSHTYALNPSI
jgi:hypothetical protein